MSFGTAAVEAAAPDHCKPDKDTGRVSSPVREGSTPDGRNPHQAGFGSREPGPAQPGAPSTADQGLYPGEKTVDFHHREGIPIAITQERLGNALRLLRLGIEHTLPCLHRR